MFSSFAANVKYVLTFLRHFLLFDMTLFSSLDNRMTKDTSKEKRPTVRLEPEEHKLVAHYCIDIDMSIGDFLRQAALYCVKHKIDPSKK